MNLKRILALSLILGSTLAAAYADGGGGFFTGLQTKLRLRGVRSRDHGRLRRGLFELRE